MSELTEIKQELHVIKGLLQQLISSPEAPETIQSKKHAEYMEAGRIGGPEAVRLLNKKYAMLERKARKTQ